MNATVGRLFFWRGVCVTVLVPVAVLAYVVGMWALDRWSLGVAFDAYLAWERVLANVAVGMTLMLLLAAMTRRLLFSVLLIAGLHALVFVISSIKLGLLGLPVILQDAYFLTGLDLAGIHLFLQYVQLPWKSMLGVAALLVGFAGLFWLEPAWCRTWGVARGVALTLAGWLLLTLYLAVWPWNARWYDKAHIRPSPLGLTQAALHGGLVASMVYYHGVQRHREFKVDTAALHEAAALPARVARPAGAARVRVGELPDVVIVLSESFMDPRILNGMTDLPDLIPALRREVTAGNGGVMRVPTYGGGTVRTEFEVLTGMPVSAFPDASYPYVDLNPGFLPGIISVLEKHGYTSLALHGNSGAFWNRSNTYKAMGIDRFLTQRDLLKAGGRSDGGWLSDRSMTDILLRELSGATKPTVAVAISIENHGPYNDRVTVLTPAEKAAISLPPGLDEAAAGEFRNYLYHLRNADREFDRLATTLHASKRPFVLLFFGDHLPALSATYKQLGFVDGGDETSQAVPWALVTNTGYPAGDVIEPRAYTWQLPAMVLRAAGLEDGSWFDFVGRVGDYLDPAGAQLDQERLFKGLQAGANARLQDRFDEYAQP